MLSAFSPLSKLLSKIFWHMRRKKTVSEFLLVQKRTVYSKRLFKQEKFWKSWKMITDNNNKKMNFDCILESGTYYSSHWDFELFLYFFKTTVHIIKHAYTSLKWLTQHLIFPGIHAHE